MTHPHSNRLSTRSGTRRGRLVLATALALALATGVACTPEIDPIGGSDGPDPAAVKAARDFLDDWAAGRVEQAGRLTSRPEEATRILSSFTDALEIEKPVFETSAPDMADDDSVHVPFTARLPITGLGTWTYESSVPVSRTDGEWEVEWEAAGPVVRDLLAALPEKPA